MIKKEKAEEIWNKVLTTWKEKSKKKNIPLNPTVLENTKKLIFMLPDEDGCKRVTDMETGKTHLVPIEDIILNGLKGDEVSKYPVEK